jgi:SAM-dependent methyltransferase
MPYRQTPSELREHYAVERELADRLRAASRAERQHLYGAVYAELFARLPHHPQVVLQADERARARSARRQLRLLLRYLRPSHTFLEIGAGDCSLALAVAERVRRVIALEVSAATVPVNLRAAGNLTLIVSSGSAVPLAAASVDTAYSHHVLEHLHSEDAGDHLAEVWRVLAPGGRYLCITPNRLAGPHDVSRHFDRVACGLHLREYTLAELEALLRVHGFGRIRVILGTRGLFLPVSLPTAPFRWLEWAISRLPGGLRRVAARIPPLRVALGVRVVAQKPFS